MRRLQHGSWRGALLLFAAAIVSQNCTSHPPAAGPAPAAAPAPVDTAMTPAMSIKELMEHIVDPTADWIFDAAVVDVSDKGTVETTPLTDEDWLKVERGAWLLAESANLLKMPREVEAPGTVTPAHEPGKPGPELLPAQIQALIDKDRPLWNKHADDLRIVALDSLKIIKARNAQGLFDIGGAIDKACESCHLEYWYPGDKDAVIADREKVVTYETPKKL